MMTEEEYIVVSNLQRMRIADQMLRACHPNIDLLEIIRTVNDHVSALENRVNEICE